jgi:hypothetical protein
MAGEITSERGRSTQEKSWILESLRGAPERRPTAGNRPTQIARQKKEQPRRAAEAALVETRCLEATGYWQVAAAAPPASAAVQVRPPVQVRMAIAPAPQQGSPAPPQATHVRAPPPPAIAGPQISVAPVQVGAPPPPPPPMAGQQA